MANRIIYLCNAMGLFGRETNRWRCTTTENMDAPWRCCTRRREINVWTNFSNFLITKWIFPSTANTMHMEFQFSHVKIVIRDISINCASTRNRITIEIGSYRTVNTGKITMEYIWNLSPRVIIVEFVSDRRKNDYWSKYDDRECTHLCIRFVVSFHIDTEK